MMAQTHGKGILGTVRRATLLPIRYGLSPERVVSRLQRMIATMDRWDSQPTIPVTASLLERHPEVVRRLSGADLAIHGYRHVSYTRLGAEEKRVDLESACRVFAGQGIPRIGFRAPYLQIDDETLELLRRQGFRYDSSRATLALPATNPLAGETQRLIAARYGGGVVTSSGRELGTPVEIPVSLPDDEVLIDGLGIRSPSGLWRAYEAMMGVALSSGSHLVLQVHPERFHFVESALDLLLDSAVDSGAWVASLSSVAAWFVEHGAPTRWPRSSSFALSVTGDLDAVSIRDFASRAWGV